MQTKSRRTSRVPPMTQSNRGSEAGGPGNRGQEVIAEASRLVGGVRVAPGEPAVAAGRHVRILVSAERTGDSVRLLVTCHALGLRDVAWDGWPLVVGGGEHVARLDARGQATVPEVTDGRLGLDLPLVWGRIAVPQLGDERRWTRSGASCDG